MIEIENAASGVPGEAEALITRAAQTALRHEGRAGDVTVLLTDDAAIHAMNREYRGVDRPTDVLSFPAWEGENLPQIPDAFLGDIAISVDTAKRQAEEYGHSFSRELSFLTVHGMLHLLGYDHMKEEEKERMFALQNEILEQIGEVR